MKVDVLVAMSLNGSISAIDKSGKSLFPKLSNENILRLRDRIRSRYDAIIVGTNTLIKDNPKLLNKKENNRRLIIDKYQNIPLDLKVFTYKSENTIVIVDKKRNDVKYLSNIVNTGAQLLFVDDTNDVNAILKKIERIGIKNVLLEGGAKIINDFFRCNVINIMQLVIFPFFASGNKSNIFLDKTDRIKIFKNISSKSIDKKYTFIRCRFR
jgi:riboflavin-specific deaminase-like protein